MVAAAEQGNVKGRLLKTNEGFLGTLGNPETMTKNFVEAGDILIKGEQRAINLMEAWNASTAFEKVYGFLKICC